MTPSRSPRVIVSVFRTFALAGAASLAFAAPVPAQALFEGFDTVTNGLPADNPNWATQNNSFMPAQGYFQGNPAVFAAHSGATNSYIGVNYASTGGTDATGDTISNWLITPQFTLNNGDTVSFYTQTAGSFADRLQLDMSTNGASTNVGTLPTDVGDFSTILIDINPNLDLTTYPLSWTQFTATVSGLSGPTDGRFAFRYFVTDGGLNGNNSNYIGIDDFQYTPVAVPEPGSLALAGTAMIGLVGVRRRRRWAFIMA